MTTNKVPRELVRTIERRTLATAQVKDLGIEIKAADERVTGWLTEHKEAVEGSVIVTVSNGGMVQATLVEAKSELLDEEALRNLIGSKRFDRLTRTVQVFDEGLLRDAIADGSVDPADVRACIKTSPKKPYTRFTVSAPPKGREGK